MSLSGGDINLYLSILLAISAAFLSWRILRQDRSLPLPPGPRRKPVVGNLFDWPTDNREWETFRGWHDTYGM
jgi:hypothetical protein